MKIPFLPYRGHCGGIHPDVDTALKAENITILYPGDNQVALDGVSLEVKKRQRVALVGANGEGKSTFLSAAAGLLPVYKGTLTLFGHRPGACQHQVAYPSSARGNRLVFSHRHQTVCADLPESFRKD